VVPAAIGAVFKISTRGALKSIKLAHGVAGWAHAHVLSASASHKIALRNCESMLSSLSWSLGRGEYFRSPAACVKTEILAKEFHDVVLETVSHSARMSALIHLEAVRDSIPVEYFMQLAGIHS